MNFFDAPATPYSLRRLVTNLSPNRLWHEDLVQEALIHLWRQECACPGMSWTWYLRSCEYHLRNCLRWGRSLDSLKRRRRKEATPIETHCLPERAGDAAGWEAFIDTSAQGTVVEQVAARDLVSNLIPCLTHPERRVLHCLLRELSARETARALKVSHTLVNRRKQRITTVFKSLLSSQGCVSNPAPQLLPSIEH